MTRREAIATFLGAGATLLPGCGDQARTPLAGKIIGADDSAGHKLRDGFRPTVAPDAWRDVGVVIVGGGIAGLTAAWKLKRSGIDDFVLLELEREHGGTSRSGRSPLTAYPWGAHYVPAPQKDNREFIELLSEMGAVDHIDKDGEPVIAEEILCREPEERIFHLGKWHEGLYLQEAASDDDLRQFAAFKKEIDGWTNWRDGKGRRAFAIPMAAGSDDPEVRALDKITMAEWMAQRGFNSSRLKWYVEYATRDDYGLTLEHASAWAGLFYFSSRQSKGGVEAQELMTWPEGNGKIANHLFEAVKTRVRTGAAVTEIVPLESGKGLSAEITAFDSTTNEAFGFRAKHVIFALPQFMARFVIRPYRDKPPAHLREFEYGAWMVANLFLKDRPESYGYPLCWDNVLYDSPSLGYVVATHQTELDRGPTILTYYYPFCDPDAKAGRAKLQSGNWNAWSNVALTDLITPHRNIREVTERVDVMRWGHAMIRPKPGFVWGGARAAAQAPFKNIHFANTDLSGVALFEEAFFHGCRTASEVAQEIKKLRA